MVPPYPHHADLSIGFVGNLCVGECKQGGLWIDCLLTFLGQFNTTNSRICPGFRITGAYVVLAMNAALVIAFTIGCHLGERGVIWVDDAKKMLGTIRVGKLAFEYSAPLLGNFNGLTPVGIAFFLRVGFVFARPGADEVRHLIFIGCRRANTHVG
jgi:hypothetical protein